MSVINRITCNDGDFVGAFRQNVIRVIGNYGLEQEPDEYDDKIKAKQEEMVALIAENAKEGSYTDEFDERYRKIAEEISTLKEEQIETRRKKKLADNYEQRLRDMAVSYTHLTLPTKRIVEISAGARSLKKKNR